MKVVVIFYTLSLTNRFYPHSFHHFDKYSRSQTPWSFMFLDYYSNFQPCLLPFTLNLSIVHSPRIFRMIVKKSKSVYSIPVSTTLQWFPMTLTIKSSLYCGLQSTSLCGLWLFLWPHFLPLGLFFTKLKPHTGLFSSSTQQIHSHLRTFALDILFSLRDCLPQYLHITHSHFI